MAISVHLRKMGNDEHLRKAFDFFDQNQSGYIEIEELREALAGEIDENSDEVINAIINDVDTDKVSLLLLFGLLCIWMSRSLCILWFFLGGRRHAHESTNPFCLAPI